MRNNEIKSDLIKKIIASEIHYGNQPIRTHVVYHFQITASYSLPEEMVFATKHEAAKAWLDSQDISTDLCMKPEPRVNIDVRAEMERAYNAFNRGIQSEAISSLEMAIKGLRNE